MSEYITPKAPEAELAVVRISGRFHPNQLGLILKSLRRKGLDVCMDLVDPAESPSIAMEYVKGQNDLPQLAVTRRSTAVTLTAAGETEDNAQLCAEAFMDSVHSHLATGHEMRPRQLTGREGEDTVCSCPLRPVYRRDLAGASVIAGVDPMSLVTYSRREDAGEYSTSTPELATQVASSVLGKVVSQIDRDNVYWA